MKEEEELQQQDFLYCVDSPFVYKMILEKYHIGPPLEGQLFNWAILHGVPIQVNDVSCFLFLTSFWYCGLKVKRTSGWRADRQHYHCSQCSNFHLVLTHVTNAPPGSPLFLEPSLSHYVYRQVEHQDRSIRKGSCKDPIALQNYQPLLDHMEMVFNHPSL